MASMMAMPRRSVRSFDDYGQAQAFVDGLADRKLPIEQVTIVGSDLHLVEQVTGRMTTAKAALGGAATGAWFGLLLALFFGLFLPDDVSFWGMVLYWTIVGAVIGAAFGAISHALRQGRRDFTSTSSIQPAHFDVQMPDDLASEVDPTPPAAPGAVR